MSMKRDINLKTLCRALSLEAAGPDCQIDGLFLAARKTFYRSTLAYAAAYRWITPLFAHEEVKAIAASPADFGNLPVAERSRKSWILSEKPEKTFYDIHDYLIDYTDFYEKFDFEPQIGEGCKIHPSAVIERGVKIGARVVVGANAVIRPGTVIGNDCEICSAAVIGDDGFQVLRIDGVNRKIRHCGGVKIGNDVSIGAHTVVHRSLFEGATVIGDHAKLDTLIYVGHNCLIGENAVITSGAILCGSTTVRANAWVAPNASVLNKVVIGENAMVGMGSVVTRDVQEGTVVYGAPAKPRNAR